MSKKVGKWEGKGESEKQKAKGLQMIGMGKSDSGMWDVPAVLAILFGPFPHLLRYIIP